jgi:hypothetical protein
MDPISELILFVAQKLGLSPVATALAIPVTIMVCNRITRLIPDTATGPLKYVRLVTKFLGAHIKDNSGVGALMTTDGNVVRQADPRRIPESTQEVLDLGPEMAPAVFKRANEALNK